MTDDEAYDALMRLGYRRVPVTVRGATVIQGYDPVALAALTGRGDDAATTAGNGAPSE